jgi:hypothetical protein
MQIGFSSQEELDAELVNPGPSLVKGFVIMMSHALDIDELPWDLAYSGHIAEIEEYECEPVPEYKRLNNTSVGLTAVPSIDFHSLVDRPTWVGDLPALSPADAVSFGIAAGRVWDVMFPVQQFLEALPARWFHPTSVEIYARTESGIYFRVIGEFLSERNVTARIVLDKGDPAAFREIAEQIRTVLTS